VQLPRTAVSTPSEEGKIMTGTWRNYRPVLNKEKCTKCLACWIYCPEGAVALTQKGGPKIDLRYCKGCGLCAQECPMEVIKMRFEGEMRSDEKNRPDR